MVHTFHFVTPHSWGRVQIGIFLLSSCATTLFLFYAVRWVKAELPRLYIEQYAILPWWWKAMWWGIGIGTVIFVGAIATKKYGGGNSHDTHHAHGGGGGGHGHGHGHGGGGDGGLFSSLLAIAALIIVVLAVIKITATAAFGRNPNASLFTFAKSVIEAPPGPLPYWEYEQVALDPNKRDENGLPKPVGKWEKIPIRFLKEYTAPDEPWSFEYGQLQLLTSQRVYFPCIFDPTKNPPGYWKETDDQGTWTATWVDENLCEGYMTSTKTGKLWMFKIRRLGT